MINGMNIPYYSSKGRGLEIVQTKGKGLEPVQGKGCKKVKDLAKYKKLHDLKSYINISY